VETGFLSNPQDEGHLRDPYYRDKLARSLLAGIQRYITSHPGLATSSKTQEVG
jgi:N-acetylmuramoyl-L-alanine amidase